MKVLFAVSSENISEAIIKKYQKSYKEILSYKNVYYFNAILKEIQKDKTYDRIVISEDLEPFSNNNYDTIDKFIFEKLDSISDEAEDSNGKETSIILICTDRRQKGNSILVKLFGIGVYNAILGNDRSMDEVCRLINRPRNKKEAKAYYRIDSEEVNYKAESENEVSEVEIQNILAHFKKLGKNTSKYIDSFNNIAVQYNDEQLKIIVNCLPISVKAILETNSEKYQELMAVTGSIASVKDMIDSNVDIEKTVKSNINSKSVGQAGKITKPIVIPSAVKNVKSKIQAKPAEQNGVSVSKNIDENRGKIPSSVNASGAAKVIQTRNQPLTKTSLANNQSSILPRDRVKPQASAQSQNNIQPHAIVQPQGLNQKTNNENQIERGDSNTNLIDSQVNRIESPQNRVQNVSYQRPRRPVPGMSRSFSNIEESDNFVQNEKIRNEAINEDSNLEFREDNAIESNQVESFEGNIENDDIITRRGRGRPRKTPVEGVVLKPKGKRGRPRKYQDQEDSSYGQDNVEENILPGFEDEGLEDFEYNQNNSEENTLPGFEDEGLENFEYNQNNSEENTLPGFEDEGLEDFEYDQNVSEENILPGFEDEIYTDSKENLNENATILPGMGFEDEVETNDVVEEYSDEVSLPGLDGLEDYNSFEDDENSSIDNNSDFIPGIEDNEYEDDSSGLLPGMNTDDYDNSYEDDSNILSSIDTFDEEISRPVQNSYNMKENNTSTIESIKPKVDYSMSSLNSLITKDKKIVTFIGTSKNGVSFLVNNLAALFSSLGINTAILDMTQNKNSYYIYTKNEDELRNLAFNSIEKLQNGYAEGIRVDKNLTVYTALPNDGKDYTNAEPILSTLVQNHSLVLIDCDYNTDFTYFASCQEMYLVQSMDILTIQPLTAFLRELKTRNILEPEKIRVVVNKELKVKSLSIKAIIGGLSYYNDPAMSFMTELFNKDMVKACTIPFEDNAYSKYLEGIVNCNISLNGFSKAFLSKLKILGDMVYPLTSKQVYGKGQPQSYNQNAFSSSMNDTLNKMKKKY